MGQYMALSTRLDEMFEYIERDVIEDLQNHSEEYRLLLDEILTLKNKHPFLEHFFEGGAEVTLSAEERKAIGEYLHLLRWKDIRERNHLYFRGHADAIYVEVLEQFGMIAVVQTDLYEGDDYITTDDYDGQVKIRYNKMRK